MLWENLREEEFEQAVKDSGGVCVIPIGCMEAHGEHLPVGTDNIEAEAVARMAAEMEPVCVFPTWHFGDVSGLVHLRGAVQLRPALLQELLENLCDEIARNGFKKILFVNYHGGNVSMLKQFCRNIVYKHKDYVVFTRDACNYMTIRQLWRTVLENGTDAYPELLPEDWEVIRTYFEEHHEDGHGGLDETSTVMAVRPETVRLDRIIPNGGIPRGETKDLQGFFFDNAWLWSMDCPNSFHGTDPVGANERIGKLLLRLRAENQAEACRRLKRADNVMEWNKKMGEYYKGW